MAGVEARGMDEKEGLYAQAGEIGAVGAFML